MCSVRSTAPFPLYFQYSFLKHPSVTNFPSSLSLPLCTLLTLGGKPIISKRAALGFLLCQTQEKNPALPSTFFCAIAALGSRRGSERGGRSPLQHFPFSLRGWGGLPALGKRKRRKRVGVSNAISLCPPGGRRGRALNKLASFHTFPLLFSKASKRALDEEGEKKGLE